MRHLLLVVSVLSMAISCFGMKLNLEHQWKYADFVWENPQQKQQAIKSGNYNASLIFLYDVDRAQDGRIFITLVRDKGSPVGLATVSDQQSESGPLLRPYPDWSWYKDDCKGITGGVYQVDIRCNHLFVVDGGRVGADQLCPPQLLIFDLSNDKLVKRVTIPISIAHDKVGMGLLCSVIAYVPQCTNVKDNAVVFMGDTEGYGLVVYNAQTSKLCRIETHFMKPTNPVFTLNNQSFALDDGIFGMAIIHNELYYAALTGNKIYKMEISKLIGCSINKTEATKQTQLAGTLPGQTAALANHNCVMFFSDITETSILCADATKDINPQNTILLTKDSEKLQFPSGIKNKFGELVVLSNRYHKHVYNTLDIKEVNFRFLSANNVEIQKQSKCFNFCN